MPVILQLIPGALHRADGDCPECGYADLWRLDMHTLSDSGVSTLASVVECARCFAEKRRLAAETSGTE